MLANMRHYDAILFDLLTALIDSWSLWNRVAGGEAAGRAWRMEYLHLTYGCGAYRPYEDLVAEAALASGLNAAHAARLEASWDELQPWDDAPALLRDLAPSYRLGVVTNCSERLGRRAAARLQAPFECVVTADLFGTARIGLDTLWHNRVGLAAPDGAPAPVLQARTLRPMVDDFLTLQRNLS
jgi:2-haloacid dehalogenase